MLRPSGGEKRGLGPSWQRRVAEKAAGLGQTTAQLRYAAVGEATQTSREISERHAERVGHYETRRRHRWRHDAGYVGHIRRIRFHSALGVGCRSKRMFYVKCYLRLIPCASVVVGNSSGGEAAVVSILSGASMPAARAMA